MTTWNKEEALDQIKNGGKFGHKRVMEKVYKDILNGILAEASGKTLAEVTEDTERDHFMSAEEAKTWGIVDKVL